MNTKKRKISKAARARELNGSKKGAELNKGNEWWKTRATHGREAIFKDASLLVEEYNAYVKWNIEHPLLEEDYVSGKKVIRNRYRPLTLKMFCIHLGVASSWWRNFKSTDTYEKGDFKSVMESIEDSIYSQQFEGASAGFLNANIIARSLGLVDRADVTSGDKPLPTPTINIIQGPKFSGSEDEIKE